MLHHKISVRDENGEIVKYGSSIDIEGRKHAENSSSNSTQERQRGEFCLEEGSASAIWEAGR
jgi:hypothetical protein